MKKKIILITMIIAIILSYTNVYADTLNNQKKSVETEIEESKENLDQIKKEKSEVLTEVRKLNENIISTQAEISDLQDKIKDLDESISAKEKDLSEKQVLLDERLSAVYMSSGNTYLEALFTGGLINFVSNYDMIRQIAEYDNNLINEVKKEKSDLENSKIELQNSKNQMQVKEKELSSKKSEREEKVQSLTEEQKVAQSAIQEKENELARINAAVKKATEEAEAAARKKAAEQAIKSNTVATNQNSENKSNSSENKSQNTSNTNTSNSNTSSNNTSNTNNTTTVSSGGMTWPTRIAHRINSIYAPLGRTDTSGYVGTAHKGIDIYAPTGTPIYAAKAGTVVYVNNSGYGGGWGLYVVIYHGTDSNGKALYTRYAHASSIASGISVGTSVTTGTVIMYAGATGAAEGAHLHFEVCQGNMYSQVNPCTYLGITNTRGDH